MIPKNMEIDGILFSFQFYFTIDRSLRQQIGTAPIYPFTANVRVEGREAASAVSLASVRFRTRGWAGTYTLAEWT